MTKKNGKRSTIKRNLRGLVIIEFTIVSIVFLIMLFGIFEGGRAIYSYGAVAHASRQAIRYTIVRGNDAALDSRRISDAPADDDQIKAYVNQVSSLNGLNIVINWTIDPNLDPPEIKNPGELVSVTVTYDFVSNFPFVPSLELTSTATGVIHF